MSCQHRWRVDEARGGHECLLCSEFRKARPNSWGQEPFTTVGNWTYWPLKPGDDDA